jgi:hypothetical protein
VVTVKVALVWPAATVTLAGTVATSKSALESETTAPPVGAAPLRVTVPVDVTPPTTEVGLKVTEDGTGGVTVSVPVAVVPAKVAETLTLVDVALHVVVAVKVAEEAPAATVTLAGTPTTLLLALARETTIPPVGAIPLRVTVQVDENPPTTEVGLKLTELGTGGVTVRLPVRVTPP